MQALDPKVEPGSVDTPDTSEGVSDRGGEVVELSSAGRAKAFQVPASRIFEATFHRDLGAQQRCCGAWLG